MRCEKAKEGRFITPLTQYCNPHDYDKFILISSKIADNLCNFHFLV